MNKIIEELKDIYHTLKEAEFVIDDSIAKGKFCLCQLKLKQVIRTLEARGKLTDEVDIIEDKPKKWKIKNGRFVVDKVLEDGSVIIAEEDEKIEPIYENLDYLDFDLLFPAVSSKRFTHNELVIINKVNEIIKRLNGE